ncbi:MULTISPECIES: carbohydrate ABC transporter permease [unclassified Arthrobacter]|uniref:carbohydrate ABC transporter permease n=1 Tax=unclassified Arthrobacter TaxID=235627 RepID=UPI001491564C|nr:MULTISPECIES: carbohydrate ABC transporter permease [unclassified Arthrobacter]MBE0008529.1 carbohydrate ABC transporter permease [Arthrobacter sp. AET 35A]NOJ59239.1 carbohydrate ABC transporter permease [Arthrobacter sp. 260]NOJ62269.1 carbohydrate ABC transporter permease [Arthrobacter sp. 147(2020)]
MATSVAPPVVTVPRERRRRTPMQQRPRLWLYVVLGLGMIAMIMPFVWMILGSFKTTAEIRQYPLNFWPLEPTLDNYTELFVRLDFATFFTNSLVVAVFVTAGNIVFSSMVGYALAKLDFAGKKVLFMLVLGTLMVPGVVTFVPLFVLTANLGLVNSYPGLILPFLIAPLGVFLMRQFMLSLPDDLIEAARIDGASEWRIFLRVIMPLCGPAVATLTILTFLASWNNFLWPLVVATSEDRYTLPVALALYSVGQNAAEYGLMMAGAVVVVLPILLIFVLLQKYFVQGIALTGIK